MLSSSSSSEGGSNNTTDQTNNNNSLVSMTNSPEREQQAVRNSLQNYVKKGAQVYIEGQLTTRKWKDEKAGIDRYSTEVVLQGFNSTFKILSSKNNQIENLQDSNTEKSSLPNEENVASNDLDDEIPF